MQFTVLRKINYNTPHKHISLNTAPWYHKKVTPGTAPQAGENHKKSIFEKSIVGIKNPPLEDLDIGLKSSHMWWFLRNTTGDVKKTESKILQILHFDIGKIVEKSHFLQFFGTHIG